MNIGKGYCSVNTPLLLPPSTKKALKEAFPFLTLLSMKKHHITLMYDVRNRVTPYVRSRELKVPDIFALDPIETSDIAVLGDGKWRALVFKVRSPELSKRHKDLLNVGFEHGYPQFTPHISLGYSEELPDKLSASLKKKILPSPLYPGKFLFRENWASTED